MSQLETTEERLAEIADERIANQQEAQNWWEKFKGNLVGNPVESVIDGFGAITDKVVDLTMIFITQTILFPLGFLYLLYRLGGRLFGEACLGGRFERRRLPTGIEWPRPALKASPAKCEWGGVN